MPRSFRPVLPVLAGILLLLLAWTAREPLLRVAASVALRSSGLAVTSLQGLQFSAGQLRLQSVALALDAGPRLQLTELILGFRVGLPFGPVEVGAVSVGSMDVLTGPAAGASADAPSPDQPAALLAAVQEYVLGDTTGLLAGLRELPLNELQIAALTLPLPLPALTLSLQARAGDWRLEARDDSRLLLVHFAQADALAPARLELAVTADRAAIGEASFTLTPRAQQTALAGSGLLQLDALARLLATPADASAPTWRGALAWTLVADAAKPPSAAPVLGAAAPTFTLQLRGDPVVSVEGNAADPRQATVLQLTGPATVTLNAGAGPAIAAAELPLQLASRFGQQDARLQGTLSLRDCGLDRCLLAFDGTTEWNGVVLSGGLEAETTLRRPREQLTWRGRLLPFGAGPALQPVVSGHYTFATGETYAELEWPAVTFGGSAGTLRQQLGTPALPLELVAGSGHVKVGLRWQPGAAAQAGRLVAAAEGRVTQLAGAVGEYLFSGLDADLTGNPSVAGVAEPTPLALSVAHLDVGLPLDNLRLQGRLDPATRQLQLELLSADLLGGRLWANDLLFDPDRARNPLLLRFSGLQLERLLALEQYEGVAASGAVSGELPLVLTGTDVELEAGTLEADPPGGSIRYLAGNTAEPSLALVNRALSNYQFDSLVSDIDYAPSGDLVLAMRLKGRNPDMDGGQRIDLNLTLTDNIPTLLRSLQSTRAIEDFLQQTPR